MVGVLRFYWSVIDFYFPEWSVVCGRWFCTTPFEASSRTYSAIVTTIRRPGFTDFKGTRFQVLPRTSSPLGGKSLFFVSMGFKNDK